MKENDFVLTTWALTRKHAIGKLSDKAHTKFKEQVTSLLKADNNLLSARLNIVEVRRSLFKFNVGYLIEAHFGVKPCGCVNKVKKPTKKQIKETPKKLYQKRDSKGRFTK